MKRNAMIRLVLSGVAAVFLATAVHAEDMDDKTPVMVTPDRTPGPNPASGKGMAEKAYNAEIKAALQPLRDQLRADNQELSDAIASGDADRIAAAKAALKEDLAAIRTTRTTMEKNRRTLGNDLKKTREARSDKRDMKSEDRHEKADEMKNKAKDRH